MRRYIQRAILFIFVFGILVLLFWGWSYLQRPSSFPFRQLQVSGSVQFVDAKEIKKVAWKNLHGGFFSLDADQLKAALMQQAWVKSVEIQRGWPDRLDLVIQEKHPEARWGKDGVVSSEGKVFYPDVKTIPEGLSLIDAPIDQEKGIFVNFQKLTDSLQLLGLRISQLTVDDRGVYEVLLSNGVRVMIGRQQVLSRFQRFVDLYPKLIGDKSDKVVKVDLRYSNGIAIKWKSKVLVKV